MELTYATMEATDFAYTEVVLRPPEHQTWPDWVKPPQWARGQEITVRPHELRFRYIPGKTTSVEDLSWTMEGKRVLKKGGLGDNVKVAFWSRTESAAPGWARNIVREALELLGARSG